MAQNYVLLETIALTQAVSSVTFDNLPTSGYTDLKIVLSTRSSAASVQTVNYMTINGLTSGYADKYLYGSGTAAGSGSFGATNGFVGDAPAASATASTFGNQEVYIPNYRSSNAKSWSIDSVAETNATAAFMELTAGYNSTTSAITSIVFTPASGNFLAYSTFSLYGVASFGTTPVTAPFASGGNIVANDGTYWYHAFLSSGTFTPLKALTCDMLVVGAGGGGARDVGGGGGAGRVLLSSSASVTASNYTMTVGAGGSQGDFGLVGGTSSVSGSGVSLSAIGGGGGNGRQQHAFVANDGWTGGGGSYDASRGRTVGNGGFEGGSTSNPGTTNCQSGGGGGAGEDGNADGIGQGGDGINTYSSWHTATNTGVSGFIAGGGAGGFYSRDSGQTAGGDGGGGVGGNNVLSGSAGVANTGAGGGGGGSSNLGGAGGAGLIIIRYPMVS